MAFCQNPKLAAERLLMRRARRLTMRIRLLLSSLVIATAVFGFNTALLSQQTPTPQMTSGSSAKAFRDEVIAGIPLQELTTEAQSKITEIIQNPSLYRRLPVSNIEVDPEYFILLARYPEIVVSIWRLMGVTQMATERKGPFSLHSDDGAGTISDIELVYGTDNYHLYYAVGEYSGPMNRRPLQGRCVIVLRTQFQAAPSGGTMAVNQLDVFLKVDNAAAGFVARTLSPIVGRTADHNFIESLIFLQRLNETTEKNGPGVQGMAYRLEGLTDEVQQMFVNVAGNVFERKQLRDTPPATSTPKLPIVAPPTTSQRISDVYQR